MPHLQLDGVKLWYEESGPDSSPAEGTIVFSHGLLWSGRMYEPQVAHFRARYRCITFDHRGQGRTEVTRSGYDMDTLAGDAAQLIERLGAGPCHFVGLSMGGFIGMRLAARRPHLIRSLTLLETAADPEPRSNIPKYSALLLVARVFGLAPVASPVMKIMFGDAFLEDPARAAEREEQRRRLIGNDRVGVVRATLGVITRQAVPGVEDIRAPTLVVSGDGERAVVPARSKATADRIPGAKFLRIPRAGHTSTIEEPKLVIDAMEDFLGSLPTAAAR